MDVLLQNVQRLTEIVENMGKMRLEVEDGEKGSNWTGLGTEYEFRDLFRPEHCAVCGGNLFECGRRDVDFENKGEKRWREKGRSEKKERFNPEEVVEDNAMDREWEKGNELSSDGHPRNIREELAEMSLRIERLERAMPLGGEESGSSSGGGEWAWWGGAWWVKTKMKMNSANRRTVHWAISQSLGKSSKRNRVYEEKTSDTDDDGARKRQKLEKEADLKRSWRVRNEQAISEKTMAIFRKASKAAGACVDTPGCSSGFQILNKDARSQLGTCCPGTRGVFH